MPVDFLGTPIVKDSMVVYPVRRGSLMILKKAQVVSVNDDGIECQNPAGKTLCLRKFDRCVVVGRVV